MSRRTWIIVAVVAALIAAGVLALARSRRPPPAAEPPAPTAVVTLAAVRPQTIQDVVTAFGVVQGDPASSITVAAPKPAIVTQVLVRVGQTVGGGQRLVEIADAPAAELAYRQAADAVTFARTDLARVQRLYDERLAATDQLNAANKAVADAQAALTAQQRQGAGRRSQALVAPAGAVVTTVTAAPGDHVAQDASLLVLSRLGAATASLGLQPGAGHVVAGQPVTIRAVGGGAPVSTRIAMVGRAADPTTKTFNALAPLPGAPYPIGAAVQGDIVTGVHNGLVVPRAAVVFDETGPHVFVVSGGKAHRVFVKVGRDQGSDIEITGAVAPGASVAVEGAYELQDGMAAKLRAAK
jgi:RND family efflux transporter MFP subunit